MLQPRTLWSIPFAEQGSPAVVAGTFTILSTESSVVGPQKLWWVPEPSMGTQDRRKALLLSVLAFSELPLEFAWDFLGPCVGLKGLCHGGGFF